MTNDWPIGFTSATLAREKRLRKALSDLTSAAADVYEVDYDQRKRDGLRFTASERIARLLDLDAAAAAWIEERS